MAVLDSLENGEYDGVKEKLLGLIYVRHGMVTSSEADLQIWPINVEDEQYRESYLRKAAAIIDKNRSHRPISELNRK